VVSRIHDGLDWPGRLQEERSMATTVDHALTAEQLATYQRDGIVLIPEAFKPAEVARMREAADRMLELLINASIAVKTINPRLALRTRPDGKQTVLKVQPLNDISGYLREVSEDARLLQPMRDIMQAEPILMEEKLLYKQVLPTPVPIPVRPDDDAVDIHHDWGAYRAQGYPTETMSSAITIDELRPEKGTLRFFPGSHRREFPLDLNYSHLDSDRIGEVIHALGVSSLDDAVDIVAPPGSVLVFHGLIVHYSGPNRTDEPRRLMIYSHHPSWFAIESDKRNGPNRARGQAHEQRYRELVASGAYVDQWTAPETI
jgi:ectoine hydroxylase-related dioxygenase (phytanoyl-CoA dioxygenase family)